MKTSLQKYILFQIILICSSNLYSQKLVVSTESIQTVYLDINNPINTNIDCFNPSEILFSDNGTINMKKGQVFWKPEKKGTAFLKLIRVTGKDTITLDSNAFYVKYCPLPTIYLNYKERHSGIGSYKSQKLIFEIESKYEYLNLQENISILSFNMDVTVESKNAKIEKYHFYSKNEFIPNEFKNICKQLKEGDTLSAEFTKVEIRCDWQKEIKYYDEIFEFIPDRKLKWIWLIQ